MRGRSARAALAVVAGTLTVGTAVPAQAAEPGDVIPGSYVVVLEPGTQESGRVARELAREHGGDVTRTYGAALKGFAGRFSAKQADRLRDEPGVVAVEPDRVVAATDTQTGATWGLDRIDQRALPLDRSYTDGTEGAGVHAYVVDTGIRATHAEFTGRMGNGYDAVTSGGSANDCNGHGTHVAGTVGGTTYGAADKVTLHAVRVLGCDGSGSTSGVIAGVDWVRANHVKPAVANMSLGGGISSALDTAVGNAITSGVTFAVAAGNENTNACNSSPARTAAAITVGSTTNTDARSSFSNYGTCLDLFAPGSSITSAWYTSDAATNTISGTSMATPHVAGAAALYLSGNSSATPADVRNAIVTNGTTGKVTGAGTGSPNVLLFTGAATSEPPPPPPPPPSSALLNGGFESGTSPWVQSPAGVISTNKPRTGGYSAWLGGANYTNEVVDQTVTVPSGGSLSYWWHLASSEGTTTAYDRFYVRVYSTSGSLLATLRSRSNTAARGAWYQDTVSLAAYAGRTVRLRFQATTDSTLVSSFHVDDVALTSG